MVSWYNIFPFPAINLFLRLWGVLGVVIICIYSVPWIVLMLVPLAFIYYDIQKRYRPASRDLKRVASVALSPIYAHFSETLSGLSTIRRERLHTYNTELA